jgi:UDP-N-acetyl-D-galactosamine dehydrogenase
VGGIRRFFLPSIGEYRSLEAKNIHDTAKVYMKSERVGIVGLGYVGLPLALALGRAFDDTVGFDVSREKIEMLRSGQDPTYEGLENEIATSSVTFTTDAASLRACDVVIVAVPTPIDENRQPDLTALSKASISVGRNLKRGAVVVYESTVYPGVTEEVCGAILERESGMKRGTEFFLGYSPERINPGDKEHSLADIVKVIAGETEAVTERLSKIYGAVVTAGLHRAPSIRVAEAAKVIENTQRDLNIALMNELSIIFDRMGIRTKDVLEAAGTKWNFLKFSPGLVGGHCIGVDPYYLTAKAQQLGYHPQVILAGRRINDDMGTFLAQRTIKLMIQAGIPLKGARIGILGVTFKENVSDIRNSRVPDIARELGEFGIEALIHDPFADGGHVCEEYGVHLREWSELKGVNGIVYAVPHTAFKERSTDEIAGLVMKGGVFVDVKSTLSASELPEHLSYWSL